jgi:Na+/melibiose symporter-like transporter
VGPLIEINRLGAVAWLLVGLGALLLAVFLVVERRSTAPMLPLSIFGIRTFTVANLVTFVVYGALSVSTFLLTVYLQLQMGYSALAAGASGLPITILLALGSARVGALVSRFGPRWFLVAGPLIMAAGLAWLSTVRPGDSYPGGVLPALVVFALGLVLVVAPVTTAALLDVGPDLSGTASGVNNAVARVAGLIAIAVLPALAGVGVAGAGLDPGYGRAMLISAALCGVGAIVAGVGFRSLTDRTG